MIENQQEAYWMIHNHGLVLIRIVLIDTGRFRSTFTRTTSQIWLNFLYLKSLHHLVGPHVVEPNPIWQRIYSTFETMCQNSISKPKEHAHPASQSYAPAFSCQQHPHLPSRHLCQDFEDWTPEKKRNTFGTIFAQSFGCHKTCGWCLLPKWTGTAW